MDIPRDYPIDMKPTPTSIEQWQKEILDWADSKGWDFEEKDIPEQLMLIVTEVSEAMEDYRVSRMQTVVDRNELIPKPCGFPSELADILIRVFHLVGRLGIDLQHELEIKHEYNKTRSHRHGGKRA